MPRIKRPQVRSIGAEKPRLNVIMIRRRKAFGGMGDMISHVKGALSNFNYNEHNFVLLPETHFGVKYFPKRKEVKNSLTELRGWLRRNYPKSKIAFSINEKNAAYTGRKTGELKRYSVHMNSGYVIGPGLGGKRGYLVYPKLSYTTPDLFSAIIFKKYSVDDAPKDRRITKRKWRAGVDRFTRIKGGQPFPRFRFGRENPISLEYRVCADAEDGKLKDNTIVAVSSSSLPNSNVAHSLYTKGKMVLINDGVPSNDYFGHPTGFGERLIAGKNGERVVYYLEDETPKRSQEKAKNKELIKLLENEGIKIHLVCY